MRKGNEEILGRRWPALLEALARSPEARSARVESVIGVPRPTLRVDGIQLSGAVDPEGEARLQALLVPEDAPRATLYGFAQGALPRLVLARPGLRELRVFLTSTRAAAATLAHHDHSDWLADPRVELLLPAADSELEVPFAATPAELRLAQGAGARLRDLVRLELATPFLRRGLANRAEEFETNLRDNAALLEADGDVSRLLGTQAGNVVRVCAAGPTLGDHFDRLRTQSGLLIAVDAALKPLLEADVVPDVVVSMDSLPHGMRAVFDVPAARLSQSLLVYFPVVPHEVVAAWPGRRLIALGAEERYAGLAELRPDALLWSSGSVVHPAIDLALRMGARRVELFGADFATPRGKSHVDGSAWQRAVPEDPNKPWVTDGHGGRCASQGNLVAYLRELERYVARHPGVDFVNAGRDGARILGVRYAEEAEHVA